METRLLKTELMNYTSAEFRCENCSFGFRHRDKTGLRKWCKKCIDIFNRKNKLIPEKAEKIIFNTAEALYAGAALSDFDDELRKKILSLKSGDDMFVYGPPGTGKTHLFAAMIRFFIYEGYEVRRINFDDFCLELRSCFFPASKMTEYEMIEPLKTVDMLFIDDLGLHSKQETDYSYVTLYTILNKRQERILSTFISSNKSVEQIEKAFDSRIASRLCTAITINLNGQDKRKETRLLV